MKRLMQALAFLVTGTVSLAATAGEVSVGPPSGFSFVLFSLDPVPSPVSLDTGMGTVDVYPFITVDQLIGTGTLDVIDENNFSIHASGSNVTTLGLGATPISPDVTGDGAWSFDVNIDVVGRIPTGEITFFGVSSPSVPLDSFGAAGSGKVAELGMVVMEPFDAVIDDATGDILFSGFATSSLTVPSPPLLGSFGALAAEPTTALSLFGSGGLAVTAVPLPATLPLLGVAAFVLLGVRRRLRA